MPTSSKPILKHAQHSETIWPNPATSSYLVPSVSGSFDRGWQNTPNFHALKRSGAQLPTQPFTINEVYRTHVLGHFDRYPTSHPEQVQTFDGVMYDSTYGQWMNWDTYPIVGRDDISPAVDARASSALLEKIKDTNINLAQFFAERAQTVDLITDSATRIAKAALSIRKGNITGALKQLSGGKPLPPLPKGIRSRQTAKNSHGSRSNQDLAAQNWLQLQYGWKPLLQDVYGAAEALAKANGESVFKRTVTSAASHHDVVNAVRYGGLSQTIVIRDEHDFTYNRRLRCTFQITNSAAKTIAETGISNPALLAWELLPYSFVVDWFIPVGNFLEALDATAGCVFLNGTQSSGWRYKITSRGSGRQNVGTAGDYTCSGQGVGYFNQFLGDRRALIGFPSPPLPQLKNPFSLTHMFNAFALMQLAFRR
jgi:hypothetical protein